jgi:FMN hydrolase / 5-amino-6-(5-phospho-D-ribitylamino)uracil phosphatase
VKYVRALSIDLDDTLWPIWPVIERAESALDSFLQENCPNTAKSFPLEKMRELRLNIVDMYPDIAHDFTQQRKLSLLHALRESGDAEHHAEAAFEIFYAARNDIEFYPDALAALKRLTARYPVAALTNGNADLHRIGIADQFVHFVAARNEGHAKPDAPIFHATCQKLGVGAHEVLHIGDDPLLDVVGAQRAGLRSCWINRRNETWPEMYATPDLQFTSLTDLADYLELAEYVPLEMKTS